MSVLFGAIHCDVADAVVVFHCDHDDDSASYKITASDNSVAIYLSGTPEQLGAFADAIVRTVSRHTIELHEQAAREAADLQNVRAVGSVLGALDRALGPKP